MYKLQLDYCKTNKIPQDNIRNKCNDALHIYNVYINLIHQLKCYLTFPTYVLTSVNKRTDRYGKFNPDQIMIIQRIFFNNQIISEHGLNIF